MSLVSRRYAGSLFKLASEVGCVEAVEEEFGAISKLFDESGDFRYFVSSPVFSIREQLEVINALIGKINPGKGDVSVLVGNFLRVVVSNRRLFTLPGIIEVFHDLAVTARGDVFVDVISAHALDPDQQKKLKVVLTRAVGKDITLRMDIDSAILGGLIVRIGTYQIDTSLRTKLSSLKLLLKEVG
ncbi:MAG: F-type H+-transporting ATPase subunit delta [Candidatus Tokpelaia sp. JSC189]|nr:MAG: F-type H+-transporting ATPase subunit delta [Candidatus Tokpelaia sp. JSC189]